MVGVALLGSAAILCLAIAAVILRYRLYDLDRVISRTLAYGLLTVVDHTIQLTTASLWLR